MKGRWPGPRPSRETLATPGTMVSPGEGGRPRRGQGSGASPPDVTCKHDTPVRTEVLQGRGAHREQAGSAPRRVSNVVDGRTDKQAEMPTPRAGELLTGGPADGAEADREVPP